MSAPKTKRSWWVGLICHLCGQTVRVSDPKGGASFHRTAAGLCWAEHHACTEARR